MPPRFSYWTIIAGGLPTAFRATEREELMPTFTRLREKHPDAEMKWFARGKLWDSPEAVREDTERRRGGFAREGGAAPKRESERPRAEAAPPPPSPKRDSDRPRESGKRAWDKPRDGGFRPRPDSRPREDYRA